MNSFTDWLGQTVYLADHVVYPQRQGSAGAELIVARVLEIETREGQENPEVASRRALFGEATGRVRVQPIRRSRYGIRGENYRPVWITVVENLTKVRFSE